MLKLSNFIKHYMKLYTERTTKDFLWTLYYTQASYKDDHELSSYQPCDEGEAHGVNNDDGDPVF